MIVPQYWAEGRAHGTRDGRSITVRRFGWSDTSLADAQANANERADEALQRILAGESLKRREPKVPYNGAAGVPIREEIVSRHSDIIITRNSYGARCLNSPDVLFADVDYSLTPPYPLSCMTFVVLLGVAGLVAWVTSSVCVGLVLGVVAVMAAWPVAVWQHRAYEKLKGGVEATSRARVTQFFADHPEWSARLYRTPAGLRVLVTHRPFDPIEPAVSDFFEAIKADAMYVRMCRNQHCFRARVSPKPWRIGIDEHMRPRPGVWPVNPARMPERQAWIAEYEAAATEFAACEFIESIGGEAIHPKIMPVVRLHDELSRAHSRLPIA